MSEERPNIGDGEWDREMERGRFGVKARMVGRRAGAQKLGATLYEITPGKTNMPYHAHHGIEELCVVVTGEPTLRTPEGERRLAEGEVVAFPTGEGGAHQLINETDQPVRVLMASSKTEADFVTYPDSSKVAVMSGEWGSDDAFNKMLSMDAELGYFDGELDD